MPQPLRIALIAFALLGITAFVGSLFFRAFRQSENPVRLAVKWIFTVLIIGVVYFIAGRLLKGSTTSFVGGAVVAGIVVFSCVVAGLILSIMWAPSMIQIFISPLTSMFDGGSEELEPTPLYSTAEALRRRGKFRESIYAIQEQLQKFPHDFTGQLMVAEIQAENLNDLQAAQTTVHRICEQKNHAPASLVFALNSLADWYLRFAQDAEAARAALEKIIALLPDTEFERAAANRIAHLGNRSVLLQSHEPDKLTLKPGVEYLGLLKDQSHLLPKEKPMQDEAEQLAAHLETHPLDHEARERLAIIYARHYGQLDLATEQIEQLVALPGESPKHVARWLNLLADLQIEVTNRTDLAEQTLRRIVDLFPNQAPADLAGLRISSLALELKHYEKTRVVKFTPGEGEARSR
jgi:tetratricopeptide (TPR) repeat protein